MDNETNQPKPGERKKGEMTPIYPKSAVPPEFSDDVDTIRRLIEKHGEDGLKRLIDIVTGAPSQPDADD